MTRGVKWATDEERRAAARAAQARYYARNPAPSRKERPVSEARKRELAERAREWRRKNPVASIKSVRKWQSKNPDKVGVINARYRESHRDQCAAKTRVWTRKNPERVADHAALRRKRVGVGRLSRGLIKWLFQEQGGRCVYCPADLSAGFHKDHINPLAKGGFHCDENIQLLCPPCNRRKGAKLEFTA